MKHVCFTTAMEKELLHTGVRRLLEAVRNEEWTLHRSLGAERECPGIREKVARASAGRRAAAELLRQLRAGAAVDGCAEPVVGEVGGWERIHADAHHAMTDLLAELAATDEDTLAAEPGTGRISGPWWARRSPTAAARRRLSPRHDPQQSGARVGPGRPHRLAQLVLHLAGLALHVLLDILGLAPGVLPHALGAVLRRLPRL